MKFESFFSLLFFNGIQELSACPVYILDSKNVSHEAVSSWILTEATFNCLTSSFYSLVALEFKQTTFIHVLY